MMKNAITTTIGGIIRWEMMKNEMSREPIQASLRSKRARPYAASVPMTIAISVLSVTATRLCHSGARMELSPPRMLFHAWSEGL